MTTEHGQPSTGYVTVGFPASPYAPFTATMTKAITHYNSGFAEYSNTTNEEGLYLGLESTPFRSLKINAYYDRFRFSLPRYQATIPGNGQEIVGDVTFNRSRWDCSFRFKHEEKPEDDKTGENLQSVSRIKQEYRLQFTYSICEQLKSRTRTSYTRYMKKKNTKVVTYSIKTLCIPPSKPT